MTPSLNQGAFIEETIRSVLLQGYPNLEYLVIDGGSTDGTLEVLERYAPWLAVLVSEPDDGQTAAINKGWQRATGDVLAYINADDCYLPNAVATALRAHAADPQVGLVYGSAVVVDEQGRQLRTWDARPFSLAAMLTTGNVVPQPAAFYSRRAIDDVGPLADEWDMIMDYEFAIRVGLAAGSICIPDRLARFRDHEASKSRSRSDDLAEELIRFIGGLESDALPNRTLRRLKRRALSRVHYEQALAHVTPPAGRNRADGVRAMRAFRRSLRTDARQACEHPLQSAYLVKEVILSRLAIRAAPAPGRR